MMGTEVKRGDTLTFDGREYVLMSIQIIEDQSGRSLSLMCRDPFLAQEVMDAEVARRQAAENQRKIAGLLPKMGEVLDEEGHDHGAEP